MFFLPPETTYSKHKVAMVYDRVDRSGAIVGIEDLGKWTKATEERRDRTLRRQVVKRRERMMDIVAKAISDMNAMGTEPGEITDLLFYSGLQAHLQDCLYAPGPETAEQDEDKGS